MKGLFPRPAFRRRVRRATTAELFTIQAEVLAWWTHANEPDVDGLVDLVEIARSEGALAYIEAAYQRRYCAPMPDLETFAPTDNLSYMRELGGTA